MRKLILTKQSLTTPMKPRIPLPKKTEKIHKDKSKYKRKPPPKPSRDPYEEYVDSYFLGLPT